MERKELCCCICFESDNKLSFTSCNFCKEGNICLSCMVLWEDEDRENHKSTPKNCPICRSLLISYNKTYIIKDALFYTFGVKQKSFLNFHF